MPRVSTSAPSVRLAHEVRAAVAGTTGAVGAVGTAGAAGALGAPAATCDLAFTSALHGAISNTIKNLCAGNSASGVLPATCVQQDNKVRCAVVCSRRASAPDHSRPERLQFILHRLEKSHCITSSNISCVAALDLAGAAGPERQSFMKLPFCWGIPWSLLPAGKPAATGCASGQLQCQIHPGRFLNIQVQTISISHWLSFSPLAWSSAYGKLVLRPECLHKSKPALP